jgi:hypothetical protein
MIVRSVDHVEHPQNYNGEGKTDCSDNVCQLTNNRFFPYKQVSYPLGFGSSLPEAKQWDRKSDHSPPSSSEVKNDGAVTLLSHMSY